MDLTDELRRQAKRFHCEVCNRNMADCDLEVLDQKPSIAVIRVTCASCREETLFHVVYRTVGGPAEDREPSPPVPPARPPISSEEMLEVHIALRDLEGGLTELLRTS